MERRTPSVFRGGSLRLYSRRHSKRELGQKNASFMRHRDERDGCFGKKGEGRRKERRSGINSLFSALLEGRRALLHLPLRRRRRLLLRLGAVCLALVAT